MTEQIAKPGRIEIEGPDGLAIRQLILEDAQAYFDALHHDTSRFEFEEDTLIKYPDVESVRASIQESLEDPEPKRLRFGIWDGSVMVGSINLEFDHPNPNNRRSAELGYWSGYGGHAYCERAARLLLPYAFSHYDIVKISAWAKPLNVGSRKVIEHLGFSQVIDGPEEVMYELTKTSAN